MPNSGIMFLSLLGLAKVTSFYLSKTSVFASFFGIQADKAIFCWLKQSLLLYRAWIFCVTGINNAVNLRIRQQVKLDNRARRITLR